MEMQIDKNSHFIKLNICHSVCVCSLCLNGDLMQLKVSLISCIESFRCGIKTDDGKLIIINDLCNI